MAPPRGGAGIIPKTRARQKEVKAYLAKASGPFLDAFDGVEAAVCGMFPQATSVLSYGMPGWTVQVREAPPPGYTGTLDPTRLTVLMADRKAGITLHLWNPLDYAFLESNRTGLEAAGFRVMRGCLQYRRKGPYPVAAIEALLLAAARHIT